MSSPPPSGPPPKMPSSSPAGLSRNRWLMAALFIAGIAVLLIGVVVIIVVLMMNLLAPGEDKAGIPLQVTRITPTPMLTPTLPAPPIPSACRAIVGSDDVQVSLSLPISLTIPISATLDSESFPIETIAPQAGGWTYPADSSGSAVWICGTVVNYIVGLEPTPENEALLAGLRVGDEIKLYRANGVVLLFHFTGLQDGLTANEASVLEQFRPRLTLIRENQDGTWQVATADYFTEVQPSPPPPPGPVVQPGQPARVGDAQVTVLRGYVISGTPGLPLGTMYYLVEFSVENVGTEPLDSGAFHMQLQDSMRNEYLPSSEASVLGEHGPLGGPVAPGAMVEGTAGYLVADTLAGPTLTWTFRPLPGSELQASAEIPYEPDVEEPPSPPARANVSVYEARLSGDGNTLIIEGRIQNTGGSPLTVELSDISLSSSAGMGNPRMMAPPLPWTIEPGQTREFELQYEAPDASAAVLTVVGFSFEIGGLQN